MLAMITFACSDDAALNVPQISDSEAKIVGDKVILSSSIDVSDFKETSTRAFNENPTLSDLNLYIVEFVDNDDPLANTLSAVYRPSMETAGDNSVIYTVTLNKTDQPRILHLLAVADDNLEIPYRVESSVMPGLISKTNSKDGISQDAYWRRLEFKKGYCVQTKNPDTQKDEWVINDDLKNKLIGKNVKLVRNFAKITVGIAEDVEVANDGDSFTLEGFMIVNTPLRGTMAPYSYKGHFFPEFLNADGTPRPYQDVAKEYAGISPANTNLGNQVTSEDAPEISVQNLTAYQTVENDVTKNWNCLPSEYLYERPFNSISRTYVIIRGKYHNRVTNPDDNSSYYKLDLGANDSNGIFRYYDILRNFNYFIRITGVHTSGYKTAAEAAVGTVYNNISFDIDTDHLMSMSDGKDIIKVNFTTAVITDNDSILEFRYGYKAGILNENNGTFNNTLAKFIDLKPGSVIKSVTPNDPNVVTDAEKNAPWRTVKITCENPTGITKSQEFTIVNPLTGLGRTITLVSHLKWDFVNLREYAGIWEDYPETYNGLYRQNANGTQGSMISGMSNSTYANLCGTNDGSQFTIFFDIPDNIPRALFPLVFTIESDNQGLENEPMGTIVVAPGPSLFPANKGDNRIQYNKRVTWTEYNAPLRMDVRDDNGTAIGNPEDGPVTHRVRCRFRTIETVNNMDISVRIANLNFNMGEVKFKRVSTANGLTGPGLIWVKPETND